MRARSALSLAAIGGVLVLGVSYLCLGALRIAPSRHYDHISVILNDSGGLAPNSPVLLTGVQIGKVTSVAAATDGARVDLRYDSRYGIPADSSLAIENLSALGEPYVEFAPDSTTGPYIRDGQIIEAHADSEPTTISQTAERAVKLIDQFDPAVISRLVGTIYTGLDGTSTVMPTLRQSTQLLAATIISNNAEFRQLLTSLQTVGGDLSWLGPTLNVDGPAWDSLGAGVIGPLTTEMADLTEMRNPAVYTTGNGIIPFLKKLDDLLLKLGPGLATATPVLEPVVAQSTASLHGLDLSSLVAQALQTVADDGTIRLRLDIQPPRRK